MDAQEFYLYFGSSYVLICQLELKLWNHNYKNLFKFGEFSLMYLQWRQKESGPSAILSKKEQTRVKRPN